MDVVTGIVVVSCIVLIVWTTSTQAIGVVGVTKVSFEGILALEIIPKGLSNFAFENTNYCQCYNL